MTSTTPRTDSRQPDTDRPAYQRPVEEVLEALGSDPDRGLSESEARARLERYGPNELETEQATPAWRRFLAQFQDVLVILLLIATVISVGLWIYERDAPLPYEGIVIFAIVLLNGILGFVQETRAEHAVAALREMTAAETSVLRNGERQRVPARELVPGDVILIEEGDSITADARLIRSTALRIAEASLTGESQPVSKDTRPVDDEVGLGDRQNSVFSGTAATYGRGAAVVTATGMKTEMGKIAGQLHQTETEPTPLQRELDRTGKVLGGIVLVISAIVAGTIILVQQARDVQTIVDALILGVALAVAAVPEGLPAVVTAVLAIGVQRMARRNAIIRRLSSVETLGSATVIASDKTGTLTKNEMTVRAVVTASGRVELSGTGYKPEGSLEQDGHQVDDEALQSEVERLLRGAARANNASLQQRDQQWTIQGDPTEGALVVAAHKVGLTTEKLQERFERLGEVPFSSERKRMSTLDRDAERDERLVLYVKGALDVVLPRCSHELRGSEAQPLDDERRAAIEAASEELASEALRTLAVAFRTLPRESRSDGDELEEEVENDLVFLGLVGMIDPPRPEAREAVARAAAAGIRPIMVTGDHPATAVAIAHDLGIATDGAAVIGRKIAQASDEELAELARETSVYARVDPEHKLRIVRALQANDEVVAMTGDGVNDAPALRNADIGVAMGITGTDVATEAADMVLADDNFATIVAAVEEGRAIFANIRKFLWYLLSSNVGEVLTMFFGVLLAGTLGLAAEGEALVLPLLATQILWINLVTDGPPALALGVDPADPEQMQHEPRRRGEGVLTRRMWLGIGLVGAIMATGTLLVLDASLPGGLLEGTGDLAFGRTMAFTTLVLFQLFNVFNARADTRSVLHGLFSNRWLWGAVLLSLAFQILAVYVPFLQGAFGTVPLGITDWLLCAAVASSVLWLHELNKLLTRR